MRKTDMYLLLTITGSLLTGCGGGGDNSQNINNPDIGFEGTWLSGCWLDDDGNPSTTDPYKITRIAVNGANINQGNSVYTMSNCSDASPGIESGISGTFVIGSTMTTPSGTAYELDIQTNIGGTDITLLDTVYINGNTLYLSGDANPTARPVTLDTTKPYSLQ